MAPKDGDIRTSITIACEKPAPQTFSEPVCMAHKMITFFGGTERLSEIHFPLGGGEGTQQGEGGEREKDHFMIPSLG